MTAIPMGAIPWFHARRKPGATAVVHDEDRLDWLGLARRSTQRAHTLRRLGVRTGDFVSFSLWNCNAFIETAFAIWMAGGIPHPISPSTPLLELKGIIELGRPKVVIGFDHDRLPGWQTLPAAWDGSGESEEPFEAEPALYWKAIGSGGSTGKPKLIVTHRPAVADPGSYVVFSDAVNDGRLGRVNGSLLNPGPLYHNGPFNLVFNNMFVGSRLVGLVRFDAERVLSNIERHRTELVYMVPTMMHRIWNLGPEIRSRYDLSALRAVLHMAASCPVWLKQAWIDWLGADRVYEAYGSTEALGSTFLTGEEWLAHPSSVGRFAGYNFSSKVRILDEGRRDVKPGEVGELFFLPTTGRGTTYHYIGAQPRTDGDYESVGDLGWMDEEGFLYLVDRRVDMILRGGSNVYPAEVEAAIEQHPDVAAAVVIGLPHEDLGNTIHAIVQPWPGRVGSLDAATLRDFMRERLTPYKLPTSYEFVTGPLRDEAGKTRRSGLREARIAAVQAGRAPSAS
ncbi:MAG TPA: AMP-binding protein [Stellaceae bacterium]|nr:AMP-binding protein [Stellaceae bacterium]